MMDWWEKAGLVAVLIGFVLLVWVAIEFINYDPSCYRYPAYINDTNHQHCESLAMPGVFRDCRAVRETVACPGEE